jgi:hypothetical protein
VTRGDLEFQTDKFVVRRGEKAVLSVRLLQGRVQVARDGRILQLQGPGGSDVARRARESGSQSSPFQFVWDFTAGSDLGTTSADTDLLDEESFGRPPGHVMRFLRRGASWMEASFELPAAALPTDADQGSWDLTVYHLSSGRGAGRPGYSPVQIRLNEQTVWEGSPPGIRGQGPHGMWDATVVNVTTLLRPGTNTLRWDALDSATTHYWLKSFRVGRSEAGKEQVAHGDTISPGQRQSTSSAIAKNDSDRPDRNVAAWVLEMNGDVSLFVENRGWKDVKAGEPLPSAAFSLLNVGLNRNEQVREADFSRFDKLEHVTTLGLSRTLVSDDQVRLLGDLPKLRRVYLWNTPVSDRAMTKLALYPKLQVIHISDTGVTDAGIQSLARLPELAELHAVRCAITDAALAALRAMTSLRDLRLQETRVTRAGVDRLHEALPDCHIESDFGTVGPDLPAAAGETGPSSQPLATSPDDDRSRDRRVAAWAHSLGATVGVSVLGRGFVMVKPEDPLPEEITDLVQAQLGGSNVPVRDEDLARIDGLRLFTVLGLTGSSITDAGLKRLGSLPELHNLYLGDTQVSDAGMAELARFPRLSILHIGGPAITVTDAGLKSVARLPLIDFRLGQCPITDAGLDALHEMKTLRHLYIPQTKVTRAGVERLHKALPECRIVSDFGALGPDWPPGG